MGCGCGAKAVKESSSKQVVRAAAGHPVSQKVVITAKKPVTRRVIKRPAR